MAFPPFETNQGVREGESFPPPQYSVSLIALLKMVAYLTASQLAATPPVLILRPIMYSQKEPPS